jgi:hypothetical protein
MNFYVYFNVKFTFQKGGLEGIKKTQHCGTEIIKKYEGGEDKTPLTC